MAIFRNSLSEIENQEQSNFAKDVEQGLSKPLKTLPSKYFYDEIGDKLFIQIMNLPEYYLTRAEMEVFKLKSGELIENLNLKSLPFFEIVELGAGDGSKTIEFLKHLKKENLQFSYCAIDISGHALKILDKNLKTHILGVDAKMRQGDYFEILNILSQKNLPKVIMFLGSNLGNMSDDQAKGFLENLSDHLNPGDKVVLGLDLIKKREVILPAYSDASGITAKFNLNLLNRINNELGGNFDLSRFKHIATYIPEEGIAKSFLESTKDQNVWIEAIGKSFRFTEGERIHTEISRKYSGEILQGIIQNSSLKIVGGVTDNKGYFTDFILDKG